MSEKIVIVGAGQAGLQAAISLRQARFDGTITMIGAEDAAPYQRPPLSKAYLKGELALDRMLLRPHAFFSQQNISTEFGLKAEAIDRETRTVQTSDGRVFEYDRLLIATGAPPRRLKIKGAKREGVYYLRTLKDSDTLAPILKSKGRVVIVGAGYIGLEVAAVARAAGLPVTVLERESRVLSRVAGSITSDYFHALHRDHGVEIRTNAALEALDGEGDKGAVSAAVLSSGEEIDCVAVLIGVGAAPDDGIANLAGLKVDNGIWVDENARTDDPCIWAAGDVANFPSPLYHRRMRLESVPNAIEQAKVAGMNMSGKKDEAAIYNAAPWFWSDQYDVKLQTAGCPDPEIDQVVRFGAIPRSQSVWYVDGSRLIAVDAMNDPAAFTVGKKVITTGAPVSASDLADPDFELKSLL
ncbi:MAG: FAD-dependent oxidoreductase [Pseudomonadota bacterium]